ncbi:alkaline phosphatase D family protein [Aquimarina algicola]|uniref:Alkaline phosphatase family protein n=1 Tax=Aquimarina algicola TaxID=2589995 RepID=A0A504J4A3_9FLAO|nr:alkaline phosphatase D family protein [Aquimarina algicola]TPN85304.1 alkaline phosphatase family protein [Aquimarina algicola]
MMRYFISFVLINLSLFSFSQKKSYDFTLTFGSCSKQNIPQPLWKDIMGTNPDVFVWGGDIIYADSDDMTKIEQDYTIQKNKPEYQELLNSVPVIGTWDDHDYGKNDAGKEWSKKEESQQLFLDFFDVPKDSPRRKQSGVYASRIFKTKKGSIKIITLDTRYFRSPLKNSTSPDRRYEPYQNGEGTVLGEEQWQWFEKELEANYSDFIVIVSSIQFLSSEHGFETWGNFPHEVQKLKKMLIDKKVRNAIVLSGDRHISEFSTTQIKGLKYPLIDFTSSGLTHSYSDYKGESNKYRVGNVVSVPSFGVLYFDFDSNTVTMQMKGQKNIVLQELEKQYPKD